ncbi:GNAT family N-acetyltransferase [Nocardioides sp. KR10-350]|uniref:GNAT family N-acetyltransferase n=1 Tax=Nocardioides cheoyonin TaxID=3156615 RepID=UPI0032B5D347
MGRLTGPLPTLRTDRLLLEPVGPSHLPSLVELNSDPAVMEFILGRGATPAETEEEWARRLGSQTDPDRGLGYWAGVVDGSFVGWWSASSFRSDPSIAGIGYRLGRAWWGRGLATEGARAMVEQAFSVAGIERVVASTMAVNTRSRHVLEKVGLVHVDTTYEEWADPLPGAELGEVIYQITRDRRGGAGHRT